MIPVKKDWVRVYCWPNDGLQLTAGKKPPAATEAGR